MNKDLSILYGKGSKKHIIGTETVPGKDNIMESFYRKGDTVSSEYIPYRPFLYLNSEDPIIGEFYPNTDIKPLFGGNYYDRIVHSDNPGFLYWVKKNAEEYEEPFTQSKWMIQSGQTQFKGMDFDDPLRLYMDIEVVTKKGYDFPNASRKEDKVVIVSMLTNRGREEVLVLDEDSETFGAATEYYPTEKKLLIGTIAKVREIDADLLVGHNFYGFDLPYLEERCKLHGVKFQLGRDGSEPTSFETTIRFAEKSDDYTNYQIYGRHVLDTYFMAKQYDVVARDLPSHGLKDCVKYLGKVPEGRVYVPGDRIAAVWRGEDPDYTRTDLIDYALDDVRETQILDRQWGRNVFAQTPMMPFPMQDTFRYGTGNKIDHLFHREYYRCGWSFPRPEPKRDFGGGYAGTGVYGLVNEPLVYSDVSSLYPTLGQILQVKPKSDELNLYPRLLDLLKEERLKYKKLAKETDGDKSERYNALQNALKILLNTQSYGYLSSQWGNFNDYSEAERITNWGRKILKRMNKEARNLGSTVVKYDTDGSLLTVPEKYKGSYETEMTFIKEIENNINEWLENEF